ncbi:MAG: hypothetical protein KBG30_03725, partial [Bacteroidales bacterium]|nr:hypothetical protein [Bacteroidales bacterium]
KLSFTIIILGAAILIYILVQNYKIKIKLQNFLDYFFNQNGINVQLHFISRKYIVKLEFKSL